MKAPREVVCECFYCGARNRAVVEKRKEARCGKCGAKLRKSIAAEVTLNTIRQIRESLGRK